MRVRIKRRGLAEGQSFVELALVVPILVLLLAGVVEIAFLYFSYMSALDLTREAARFASARDYRMQEPQNPSDPFSACTDTTLNYYFDTSCFFIDPEINSSLELTSTDYADVAISVFTVTGNHVTNRWPDTNPNGSPNTDGVFSLYQTDGVPNWKLDCEGNIVRTEPFMTNTELEAQFQPNAPTEKGFVMVEVYYCYHHKLGLPFLTWVISNPMRMHAYTIMPAAEANPTPTPIANP
jgi:TadE-like protein